MDLAEFLEEFFSSRGTPCSGLIKSRADKIAHFAKMAKILALVVQEENFHTLCAQRSSTLNPSLLLSIQQALFDDLLIFALPNAGQLHDGIIVNRSIYPTTAQTD